MSQDNVETVRAGLAAYNRGDLDAVIDTLHPDVEFRTLLLGNHRGRETLRTLYEENRAALPDYKLEPIELIEAGEQVVAVVRLGGAGRLSQLELDNRMAFLVSFEDGLISRQQTFRTKEEALEAVRAPRRG